MKEYQIRTAIKAYFDAGGDPEFYIISKQRLAEIQVSAAGIAAHEINQELGLDLTENGQYYLNRHVGTPNENSILGH